eukprot:scaffold18951_cov63-Phaeocystis_antarctica.AAC.8
MRCCTLHSQCRTFFGRQWPMPAHSALWCVVTLTECRMTTVETGRWTEWLHTTVPPRSPGPPVAALPPRARARTRAAKTPLGPRGGRRGPGARGRALYRSASLRHAQSAEPQSRPLRKGGRGCDRLSKEHLLLSV